MAIEIKYAEFDRIEAGDPAPALVYVEWFSDGAIESATHRDKNIPDEVRIAVAKAILPEGHDVWKKVA